MKKLYICTIITSFEKDCVLIIIFTKAGLHKSNLFWMGQYDPTLNLHIGRRTNPLLKVVSTTFLLVCFVSERERESTCETRKNVFYFTSKALFVPEIIKF